VTELDGIRYIREKDKTAVFCGEMPGQYSPSPSQNRT
jgi:hypothetical protein